MATIEDYICEHLSKPLRLKDGSQVLNDDGKPVTKEEGIAMNVVNQVTQRLWKRIASSSTTSAALRSLLSGDCSKLYRESVASVTFSQSKPKTLDASD